MSTALKTTRSIPLLLVLAAPFAACGGAVQGGTADAGGDAKGAGTSTSAPTESCESVGGKCGPTPDLPCNADESSVRARCPELEPCCVKLPPLGPGECRTSADCGSQNTPGRSPGTGACEGNACVCDAVSTRLENGRCGPVPEAGESYLCTIGTAFPKSSAVCGVIPCDPGALCALSGATAQCIPPQMKRTGEETCVLVNCGAIFCAPGLVCTDPSRGVCKTE